MGNAVPVEHLLFLLGANAVVLIKEIKERALGFFEGRIGASLKISQVGKDTLLEFLRILNRATERLESESETTDDIGTGNVKEITPVGKTG